MCSFVQTHPAQFTCKFHKFTSFMHTCGVCVCVCGQYIYGALWTQPTPKKKVSFECAPTLGESGNRKRSPLHESSVWDLGSHTHDSIPHPVTSSCCMIVAHRSLHSNHKAKWMRTEWEFWFSYTQTRTQRQNNKFLRLMCKSFYGFRCIRRLRRCRRRSATIFDLTILVLCVTGCCAPSGAVYSLSTCMAADKSQHTASHTHTRSCSTPHKR